jgi:glutathione peroxidase
MTLKQKIIRFIYPLLMKLGKQSALVLSNKHNKLPVVPIYHLNFISNRKQTISLDKFRGKKLLLVNTASECGYTPQYKELQALQENYKNKLVVIGFPSNDFKEQEKLNDEEISRFCEVNFGVTFTLGMKTTVKKDGGQNEVFKWLSSSDQNGWNNQEPKWNFSKYLVDENGVLTHYFDPSVSPLDEAIVHAVVS